MKSPAKAILFGEHAVVYGYRAISMAINLYSYVNIKESNDITLYLHNLNKSLTINLEELKTINPLKFGDFKYSLMAIKKVYEYLDINNGIFTEISSQIPVSCGLGSSASITLSLIRGISNFFGYSLTDDEIAELGYQVEKEVQGKASRTDTATITYKGTLEIKKNKMKKINNDLLKSCKFLVVFVENRKKGTSEIIKDVAKCKDKDIIFKEIDALIDEFYNIDDKRILGNLMYRNHLLLKKLNISTPKIDKIVEIGNIYGYGAKLTGAGGGGCVLILVDESREKELINRLINENVKIFDCKVVY